MAKSKKGKGVKSTGDATPRITDDVPLWHEETDPKRAGEIMISVAQGIEAQQAQRRERNLRHAKLWSNQDLSSIYDCGVGSYYDAGVYLSVNVIESCGSTLMAKLSRSKVRPNAITERGSRSLRRNAEKLTTLIDGVYADNELHEETGERIFLDGQLFGSGVAYAYGDENKELRVERVVPDEILIDDSRGKYGLPGLPDIYRRQFVHRETLMRMRGADGQRFGDSPETRLAIKMAAGSAGADWYGEGADMVKVYGGWLKASGPGKDDGRHILAIPGAILYAAPYKRARLPFEFFHWNLPTMGVWGRSLAEQLVPIQLKINELIETIDEGQRLNALGRTYIQRGAINPDDINNLIGSIVETMIPPSQAVVHIEGQGATREIYDQLETWIRRAFEVTGVSMLSATGEKPEGVGSAVALRELLDREDMRYGYIGKRWERFHRNLGMAIIDVADELYGKGATKKFFAHNERFVATVEWSKIDTSRDKFRFVVAPASALPSTPGAKRQYAREMLEDGVITKARYLELVDEPDTKDASSRVRAVEDAIGLDLENIVESGKVTLPDEFTDPALAMDMALIELNKARNEGVEPNRLEMLRRYIKVAAMKAGKDPMKLQQAGAAGQQAVSAEQAAQAPAPMGDPLAVDPMAEAAVAAQQPDLAAMAPPDVPGVAPAV